MAFRSQAGYAWEIIGLCFKGWMIKRWEVKLAFVGI